MVIQNSPKYPSREAASDIMGILKYHEPVFILNTPEKPCYFLFILQMKSTQKDSFVHDVLHSSLFNGKSSSFPSVYFIAVKTRFLKAGLSYFQ